MAGTVTLYADNPEGKRSNPGKKNPGKRNPTTTIAGAKFEFPSLNQVLGGAVGMVAAVTVPKLLTTWVVDRVMKTASDKSKQLVAVAGGFAVNAAIAAFAMKAKAIPKDAAKSFALVAGLTHGVQAIGAVTDGKFGLLTPPGSNFKLPGTDGVGGGYALPAVARPAIGAPAGVEAPLGNISLEQTPGGPIVEVPRL